MEKGDWALIQTLLDAFERASLSDILSTLALLIPFLLLGSLPLVWALKKGYNEAVKHFEAENPHLKGQYFSFWKWVYLSGETNIISTRHYKKQFGDVPFINTDDMHTKSSTLRI